MGQGGSTYDSTKILMSQAPQKQKRKAFTGDLKINTELNDDDDDESTDEPSISVDKQPYAELTMTSNSPPLRRIDHTYHDYASHHINENDRPRSKRSLNNFPAKLHAILSNPQYSHILTWQSHGRAWKIINRVLLVQEVIPAHWAHTKYESFTRQLNGWGFKRLYQSGPDFQCYYHECFLRGLPQIVQMMRRIDSNLGKQLPNVEGEPNFYEMHRRQPLPNFPPRSPPVILSPFPLRINQSASDSLPPYPFHSASHFISDHFSSHSNVENTPIDRRHVPFEHDPSHVYDIAPANHWLTHPHFYYNQNNVLHHAPIDHRAIAYDHDPFHRYGIAPANYWPLHPHSNHNQYNGFLEEPPVQHQHQYHSFPVQQTDHYRQTSQIPPPPPPQSTHVFHQIHSSHFDPNQHPRYSDNSVSYNDQGLMEGLTATREAAHPYYFDASDNTNCAASPPTSP